jgi:hypothetical protein
MKMKKEIFFLHRIEQISPALRSLERFRYQFVVIRQMRPAMDARIRAAFGGQIRLERFHFFRLIVHLDHRLARRFGHFFIQGIKKLFFFFFDFPIQAPKNFLFKFQQTNLSAHSEPPPTKFHAFIS